MKEKSFERKTELLESAIDEFISKNYDEASLNRIIKSSGISKGTFYYHFKDKQSLYFYLLEKSVKTKWGFIGDKIKDYNDSYENKDIFEKFKLQARLGAKFAISYPKYHKLGRMFAKEKGKEIYEIAKDMLGNNSENLLEDMINTAINNGDFREDLPRDFIIKIINYMFIHFSDVFQTEEDFELERMINNLDSYVEFMKNGLSK